MPPQAVEQYRRLAATLHHLQSERGIKVVMVTSALSGEGKSLTSTNLALTLSQSYRRRVLLIDGDLRRPSIHQIFEVQNSQGLSEGIKSDSEEKLSITEIFENLSILTAGKPDPDPMSSLTSERMRRIVAEARMKFDWVIIDTPPVALLPGRGPARRDCRSGGAGRRRGAHAVRHHPAHGRYHRPRQDHGRGAEPRGDDDIQGREALRGVLLAGFVLALTPDASAMRVR